LRVADVSSTDSDTAAAASATTSNSEDKSNASPKESAIKAWQKELLKDEPWFAKVLPNVRFQKTFSPF
jgi:hypothetical protein